MNSRRQRTHRPQAPEVHVVDNGYRDRHQRCLAKHRATKHCRLPLVLEDDDVHDNDDDGDDLDGDVQDGTFGLC